MFLTLLLNAAADIAPPRQPLLAVEMVRDLLWNETSEPEVSEVYLRRYEGQLRHCYRLRLAEEPSLAGLVVLDWTVGEGRTLIATAPTNTTEDAALSECLTSKLKEWSYSSSVEGRMIVSLTFSRG
ncbi:MAG: hypothetical protein ACI8RZ_000316 [Myxococcota bacterium]|jgi:hypothetical protein